MPIDVDVALSAELEPLQFSWCSSDIQLYHLGLGAGKDPMDPRELRYLVDDTPQVLPTFGNVAASFHMTKPPTVQFPGIDIELSKVLHASERIEVPGPLPPSGSATAVTRFTDIWDKGKAAVIWSETTATAPDGTLLWTQRRSIYARGEGGFGGERGPSGTMDGSHAAPDRAPDLELEVPILPQQALLYRLCGDRNPLHSDPEFAAAAGFSQPILHGLCTYGMTCKAITDALLDGDAGSVAAYGARFSGVAFPGETLRVNVWKEDGRFLAGVIAPSRDDAVVLSGVELVPA
ncbi:MaoC family dehydratase [Mycobacterium sherrisii]|uniref:3-alpha,7-alpha, 12-alpha-trihydroxy-5-beta-cholest-24-enoyl-CoA hydratase n=1 Tax=Mycobacterium sherrisii TaxID=243061 RepID=A0A1E3SRY0_9MYCO|nr:MaoC family dehydratase [Mycobacterium sherrisii]MCV7027884.1 MaoC family dehydratase N-terminal domain-containing protein [Mycobacterium sherrisii]ODR04353.1 3-alpha,7-alpha,12-alpha-trihydroxy-5-beta-cholest-24-enoyl-CoA hydratase [Mycobacterium sherrisii]ORW84330.1 3-alpha,7-alpha,12-alpha-trihydroxy-5-beta-cholest-24-enoyl-CoA hydratase [Mycobacterium sherrisii]